MAVLGAKTFKLSIAFLSPASAELIDSTVSLVIFFLGISFFWFLANSFSSIEALVIDAFPAPFFSINASKPLSFKPIREVKFCAANFLVADNPMLALAFVYLAASLRRVGVTISTALTIPFFA